MLCCTSAFAQNDPYEIEDENAKSYTASNGITYREGDSVKLGYGSSANGYYQFLQLTGFAAGATMNLNNPSQGQLDAARGFANLSFQILKIKRAPARMGRKVYFVIKGPLRYALLIEDAIAMCEVLPCKEKAAPGSAALSGADELAKYKKLMDEGVITLEEFAEKKKQILSK